MWIEIIRAYGRDRCFENYDDVEYKVVIKTKNGRKLMVSRAWSPRKIDALRIAQKIAKRTGLKIR